ncbi:MAG: ThiF family adenylyltransferase, partial [Sulfolobales archaeon]|nr:ThiF family adenylyltransferase [Sulfolobales archaeon]
MGRESILERYSRQLPLVGVEGQEKLRRSAVLVVGAGGLGSSVLLYLAAAGVGRLMVIDRGYVDPPDLNRQILYSERDVGKAKARRAVERLREL